MLPRRQTISRRAKPSPSSQQHESWRELARTRTRLISTGIATRGILAHNAQNVESQPIPACQHLQGTIAGLHKSLTTSFAEEFPKATSDLSILLSNLESRQARLANEVQSSLTKTRKETSVEIADIATEQTSTLLLQLKAVEDKMDALEYRANSGWTHEKTLHWVFLVLEYIVMGSWRVLWAIVGGIIQFIRWLFFFNA
jgi:hypothetical protein